MYTDLVELIRKALLEASKVKPSSSKVHLMILDELRILFKNTDNISIESGYYREGYFIDIAIFSGAKRIALELQGPQHYDSTGKCLGGSILKQQVLKYLGWNFVPIHLTQWDNKQPSQRTALFKILFDSILNESQTPKSIPMTSQTNVMKAEVISKQNSVSILNPNPVVLMPTGLVNNATPTLGLNPQQKSLLNKQISQALCFAETSYKIFEIIDTHLVHFDHINVCMVLKKLAKRYKKIKKILFSPGTAPGNVLPLELELIEQKIFKEKYFKVISDFILTRIQDMTAQNCANLAWAYATLAENPEGLIEAIAIQVLSIISTVNAQECANLAWVCAALEQNPINARFFQTLMDRLYLLARDLSNGDFHKIHHSLLFFASKNWPFKIYDDFLELIKDALNKRSRIKLYSSRNHRSILLELKAFFKNTDGIRIETEFYQEGYFIDIAIFSDTKKIALDANNSQYYNATGKLLGKNILKERVLKYVGWDFLRFPVTLWNKAEPNVRAKVLKVLFEPVLNKPKLLAAVPITAQTNVNAVEVIPKQNIMNKFTPTPIVVLPAGSINNSNSTLDSNVGQNLLKNNLKK